MLLDLYGRRSERHFDPHQAGEKSLLYFEFIIM